MPNGLQPLGHIVRPKPNEPNTTPSLREAIADPVGTLDSYLVTPSLWTAFREVLDKAVHKKGQGYWIKAEYGAGKAHFLAALTLLLTNRDPAAWAALHDDDLRAYQAPLTKLKLFPVTFSLLGAGEADAGDSLLGTFLKEIRSALPSPLAKKVSVLSEELAAEWYDKQAGALIKETVAAHFKARGQKPEEFRKREGERRFGEEVLKLQDQGVTIDVKGAFRERFAHVYDRITRLGGYDGLLFVVDEFRSWQDRHEGKPSFEEGVQLLETLAYYLPVEEKLNIITVVASQGDCPQKLFGAGDGDRFLVRELLKEQADYGAIVCYRARDVLPGKHLDAEAYYGHCRERFRFLRKVPREYFQAIFPFQPGCFDLLRRVTQSYERYGLPAARSGIHIAYETLRNDALLAGRRLVVLSDLLHSATLAKGLRSDQFKASFESYQAAGEELAHHLLDEEEQDLARRILGTLYLWSVVHPDPARGMSIDDLAEATLADLEGLLPKDAVFDLVMRLKSDVPQIKYDKDKGVRFEIADTEGEKPERFFPSFKKKAKADADAQDRAWRAGLFWDFKALEGAGSEQGFEGGFFDGYADRDANGQPLLPNTTPARATPRDLRVQYGGEVIVADRWQSAFGETWPNKPEVHFRIVYLTAHAAVDKAELLDPRIAVCVPAALSPDTREDLAELVACDLMLAHYNERDFPNKGPFRDWARTRRRNAIAAVLGSHIAEFRLGAIVTRKELGLAANQFFQAAAHGRGKREEGLAARLLEKAYDTPLFTPRDFKKDFTESDARKVFHGLFDAARAPADASARDNFAPGLGLVAKNDPANFAAQPGSAVARIQDRLRAAADLSLAELVKELCAPPHGLTEEMVRLAALCAVRAGNPPLVLAELNPSAGLKLANGKEPPGKRLNARFINQVKWGPSLEKALLGARLKPSDEKSFNDVLAYARVIGPALAPTSGPAEDEARNASLLALLEARKGDLPGVRDNLKRLANVLGGSVDEATHKLFARLEAIAATASYTEFHEVARANYETPELFKAAHDEYERARRLTARYPELQATREYLNIVARLDNAELNFKAQGLLARLGFASLWADEAKLPALLEEFRRFREAYLLAYRKAHRDHHDSCEAVRQALGAVADKLTVIERLNALELGAPVGPRLSEEVRTLADVARPCALKDNCPVDDQPRCPACAWDGQAPVPQAEAEVLIERVREAAAELCKRIAQEAIRKVLEASGQPTIHTLLEMITAARVEELARVLTPDAVAQMKGILAAANVEHRDLPLAPLLEDWSVLDEDRLDDFLRRLRERLRGEFDKARRETEGKKRVRFLLK
jgi:hypothetical protein